MQEKVELGLAVAQKMIRAMEIKLGRAIEKEEWALAAHLDSYLSGMRQALIVFKQAVGDSG